MPAAYNGSTAQLIEEAKATKAARERDDVVGFVLFVMLFFGMLIWADWLDGPVDTTGLGATMRGNPDHYWQVKYHTERGEYEEANRIKRRLDREKQ